MVWIDIFKNGKLTKGMRIVSKREGLKCIRYQEYKETSTYRLSKWRMHASKIKLLWMSPHKHKDTRFI